MFTADQSHLSTEAIEGFTSDMESIIEEVVTRPLAKVEVKEKALERKEYEKKKQ